MFFNGLDLFLIGRFYRHEAVQKSVFRKQLNIAIKFGKPLVIHCRDAEEDCLEILKEVSSLVFIWYHILKEVSSLVFIWYHILKEVSSLVFIWYHILKEVSSLVFIWYHILKEVSGLVFIWYHIGPQCE